MSEPAERPAPPHPDGDRLLAAGMLLWTLVFCLHWPAALSFGDEIGYVGQARLLLQGQVRPSADSPGVWVPTPHGPAIKYPLLLPILPGWPAAVPHEWRPAGRDAPQVTRGNCSLHIPIARWP